MSLQPLHPRRVCPIAKPTLSRLNLWSPKRKANGHRNPFYDFMREVAPGDVIFSFADTRIVAIGLVASNAYEAPKPAEFGNTGAYWHIASDAPLQPAVGLVEWEEHELQHVQSDITVPETERTAIVLARRGQGVFKERVQRIERACRITGVDRLEHLDGENGLLLTPNADHLFDRGFIGFDDNGDVLVSLAARVPDAPRLANAFALAVRPSARLCA